MNILPTAAASFLIISAAVGAIISPPSGCYQRQHSSATPIAEANAQGCRRHTPHRRLAKSSASPLAHLHYHSVDSCSRKWTAADS